MGLGCDIYVVYNNISANIQVAFERNGIPISLPYDGYSYKNIPLIQAIKILKNLKKLGYVFPDRVIDQIEEQITEDMLEE